MGDSEQKLAAAEGTWAYHTVQHNQTFRSTDCTSKLVQKCFEPKFSTARTKTEAIVCNVLAPYAMEELECDLECANFVSIFTGSSIHNSIKMFPVLVRYFKPTSSVHVKILEMTNDVIVRPILYRLYNVYSKLLELLMIIGEYNQYSQSFVAKCCCI